jgi:retron-type reverse transcriptase
VRGNRGVPGVDQTTIGDVERYGVARLLDELAADLKDGSYWPLPARRVFIAKPGTSEQRPLSIPAVRDRIVQTALKTSLSRSLKRSSCPAPLGFVPSAGCTRPCRCSLMSPGEASGGW